MSVDARLRKLRQQPMIETRAGAESLSEQPSLLSQLLPHRGPMLLVDQLVGWHREQQWMVGHRHIYDAHMGLDGHFPDDPVLPGTLLLEMLGQVGVALFVMLLNQEMSRGAFEVRATKIKGAHFMREVRPGDDVELVVRALEYDTLLGECEAQALVDGRVMAVMMGEVMVM